jgi:hypothetical protein
LSTKLAIGVFRIRARVSIESLQKSSIVKAAIDDYELEANKVVVDSQQKEQGRVKQWIAEVKKKLPAKEKIKEEVKEIIGDLKTERDETVESAKIIARVFTGKKVSNKEKEFAAKQSGDLLKMAGMGIVAAAPGGSIAVPVIVKAAKKVEVEMIPSAFQDNAEKRKKKNL